ncbi:hypothetical protein HZS_4056, partial [Henneguya salminicola]
MLDSRKEFHAIFDNEELAIIYLMQMEVVQAQTVHNFCQGTVKQYSKQLRCSSKSCRKRYTFFLSKMKISLNQVLETDYYWPSGIKRGQIETVRGISNVIVTTIAQNLRKLVSNAWDFNNIIPGDDGIIVTIDEAKLSKEKYYRWNTVDGTGILGEGDLVDSNSGVGENTITGTWDSLKYKISKRNRTNFLDEDGNIRGSLLDDLQREFQWRR